MAGPVVVGTSLLDSNGKVKSPSEKSTSKANPGKLMTQLATALGEQAVNNSPTNTTSVGATTLPIPNSSGLTGTPAANASDQALINSFQSPMEAAARSAGNATSGWSPLQLNAALKLAAKQEGPFDNSPYAQEIAALQSQAGLERGQAQHGAARAEADDAALYGSLENYVRGIAGQTHKGNIATEHATQAGFAAASQAINDVYNNGLSSVEAFNNSRGLTGGTSALQQAHDFQSGQIKSDKALNLSDVLQSANDANNNMNQTKIDVHTTGTGAVASQKAALNTALEGIATSLAGQLGTVDTSQTSAESAYNQQLRQAALALIAANAKNNPNTMDNRIKQLEIDNGLKKLSTTSAASTAGESKLQKAESYLDSSGIPQAHLGTDLGIFRQLINGELGADPLASKNSSVALGNMAKIINKQIVARKGQGYTNADQQAIIEALHTYLGD